MRLRLSMLAWLALAPYAWAQTGDGAEKSIYQGTLEQRVDAIASIQPGLGTVMREIAYRFANAYWAANGGNWGLAQYQLAALREALDVAMLTRPHEAPMLKSFDRSYREPLAEAIANTDLGQFNQRFSSAIEGCNACHTRLGHGFLRYQMPQAGEAGGLLDFSAKTEPKSDKPAQ